MSSGLVVKMLEQTRKVASDLVFFPIDSTHKAEGKKVAEHLSSARVDARALLDADGKVGKTYGAQTTPQCFVVDSTGLLRYAGAFDADPAGMQKGRATNYVVEAVKLIVAGKPVSPETTKSYGESVKYRK